MKHGARKFLASIVMLFVAIMANAQYDYNYGPPQPPPRRAARPQQPEKKDDGGFNPTGYVTVNIGAANPLGAFATRTGTSYGNYAIGGTSEYIAAGIPLGGTNIGLALMGGYYDNPFDMNGYVNSLIAANNTYAYYGTYADDYAESTIMAGVFYTWPVKRFSFDFRALAGIMVCALPEIDYSATAFTVANGPAPTNDFDWDYAPSRSNAFAYDIGAGIRYKLRRTLCISASVDYCAARPTFSTIQIYTDQYGNEYQSSASGSIPISLLSISVGIGYQFK